MTSPDTRQIDADSPATPTPPDRARLSPTVWVAALLILTAIGLLAWALFGPRTEYAPDISTRTYTPTVGDDSPDPVASSMGNPLLPADAIVSDFDPPAGLEPADGAEPLYGQSHTADGMTHEMGYYAVPGDDLARVQQHYIGQAERLGFTRERISSQSTGPSAPHRVMFRRNGESLIIDLAQRDGAVRVLVWLSYTEGSR